MNLFGLSITRASRSPVKKSGGEVPLSQAALAWLRGDDGGLPGPSLSNAYQQVVWVYRAINVLAEQVANIPFLFSAGQRGREDLITSGPLLDFYARPHPQMNRFQYWELRIMWLMLRGECIRIPIYQGGRGSSRALKKVLIVDPANFQHIIENNRLAGWRYSGFGPTAPLESQVFLPEEVWFEKLPNPFDFWRGMPPLSVAALAAKTDFASGAFMHGLMENNADLGVIVRTDQQLDDAQQEQILANLRNRKRRAGTADRPMLLWGVNEIVKPTLSSADIQFLENRKFSRAEICAAFGVPEEIVTTTDNAKYDVMAGSRLNFIENRVAPLCARLEAEEEITVKSIDPTATGWFDIDSLPLMQQARHTRLATARTGFDMGIPFNELNRVLDLGFKPLACGDDSYLPAKLQKVTPAQPPQPKQIQLRSLTPMSRTPSAPPPALNPQLSATFGSRLVTLSDGRPGLRGGIHVEATAPGSAGVSPATLEFISSDETLDRYGEIISAGGWQLTNYLRNPVFQNSHQYGDIIFTLGKALLTEVRQVAGRQVLFQRVQFAVEASPMARIAHALYSGGFLKTVSVGFIPLRWEDGSESSSSSSSVPFRRRFIEQELLEVSAVSIPANPNALTLGLKSGAVEKADLRDLSDLLRHTLSPSAPQPSTIDYQPLYQLARQLRDLMRHT